MQLIAFTGKMGSGKTTACDHLIAKGNTVKVNFKDALIAEMKERLPDTLEELANLYDLHFIDDLFTQKPPAMRALMQNYGTEVRRRDNPDYWTKQYEFEVQRMLAQGFTVVTDDCRFLNEAQTVKKLGGTIIRIERDDIIGGSHQSETEMDSIVPDIVMHTEKGNLEGLYAQLDVPYYKGGSSSPYIDLGV